MLGKYIGNRPNAALLILRIVLGLVFLAHGLSKFSSGVENIAGFFASIGIPAALFFAWVVAIVETVGGIFLILGILTRWSSLLLSIVMVVAILSVKWNIGLIGGEGVGYELDLALLAGSLALLLQGAGRYSIDAMFGRKKGMGQRQAMGDNQM